VPLGKVLRINDGNRIVSLISMASCAQGLHAYCVEEKGPDHKLSNIEFKQGDVVTTILKCANGQTITLTLDTTLPRTYSRDYTIHGTKAAFFEQLDGFFFDSEHRGLENKSEIQGNMEKYPLDGDLALDGAVAIETSLPGAPTETTVSFPGEIVEGEMVEYFPNISSVINDNPRVIADKLCGIDAKYLCDEWSKAGYYVEEKENNTYVYKYEDTVLELTYVDFETITCVVVRYADGSVSEYKRTPDKTTGDETMVHETVRTGELPPPVETMGEPIPQD
jgi:hypothetical protein